MMQRVSLVDLLPLRSQKPGKPSANPVAALLCPTPVRPADSARYLGDDARRISFDRRLTVRGLARILRGLGRTLSRL